MNLSPRNKIIRNSLITVALCAVSLIGEPALAGTKGKLNSHAVLVTGKQDMIKVDDKPDHTVLYAEMDGVMFSNDGGKFLDKARYQVVYVSDSSGMVSGGYKTFTESDGSKAFAKFKDNEGDPNNGTFEFIGGTGKYAGIKGHGTWTFTSVADTVAYDILQGEYELP